MRVEMTKNGYRRIRSDKYEAKFATEAAEKAAKRAAKVRTVWPAVTILPVAARETTYEADLAQRIRSLRDKPHGFGAHKIAKRLGVSWRTVTRVLG
jgi:hypothetical protein